MFLQVTPLISYNLGELSQQKYGGNLLVGQDSAMFDLWHRRRIENPWEVLFGDASAKNVVADAVAATPAGVFVGAIGSDYALRQWHYIAMWFFILFSVVHVYLVFYHDYVEGRGIISSMAGGWKFVERKNGGR